MECSLLSYRWMRQVMWFHQFCQTEVVVVICNVIRSCVQVGHLWCWTKMVCWRHYLVITTLWCHSFNLITTNWHVSTSDLYPDTGGAYDCDINKLTCIHKWPVSRYNWCLWLWRQEIYLYPQVTYIQIQVELMTVTSPNWPVSTNDLYPYASDVYDYEVKNLPVSTSDLYPDTGGAYECDVNKLTYTTNDLYPDMSGAYDSDINKLTCIQIQVGCREQSRCIQTFNRGCFKMRGNLKLLRRK